MALEIKTSFVNGYMNVFRGIERDHKPSWKRAGWGMAELQIESHQSNPYLAFRVTEVADAKDGHGRKREARITLEEHDGRSLYEWLAERYAPKQTDVKGKGPTMTDADLAILVAAEQARVYLSAAMAFITMTDDQRKVLSGVTDNLKRAIDGKRRELSEAGFDPRNDRPGTDDDPGDYEDDNGGGFDVAGK